MARADVRAITLLGTDSRAIDGGRCAAALLERLQYKFTLSGREHFMDVASDSADRVDSPEIRRLLISAWDFGEAANLAGLLLHLGRPRLGEDPLRPMLRDSVFTAFVVTYARAFSGNHDDGVTARSVDVSSFLHLTAAEDALHARIREMRNRAFAHSDPREWTLEFRERTDGPPYPVVTDPRVPFSLEECAAAQALASRIATAISGRLASLGYPGRAMERA
jgi:hypothetical protein